MQAEKKISIYYRDLPEAVLLFLSQDKNSTMIKDGVHKWQAISCPRVTILLKTSNSQHKDKTRWDALARLLDELEKNNQIIGWVG
jgi:hypothetical protein